MAFYSPFGVGQSPWLTPLPYGGNSSSYEEETSLEAMVSNSGFIVSSVSHNPWLAAWLTPVGYADNDRTTPAHSNTELNPRGLPQARNPASFVEQTTGSNSVPPLCPCRRPAASFTRDDDTYCHPRFRTRDDDTYCLPRFRTARIPNWLLRTLTPYQARLAHRILCTHDNLQYGKALLGFAETRLADIRAEIRETQTQIMEHDAMLRGTDDPSTWQDKCERYVTAGIHDVDEDEEYRKIQECQEKRAQLQQSLEDLLKKEKKVLFSKTNFSMRDNRMLKYHLDTEWELQLTLLWMGGRTRHRPPNGVYSRVQGHLPSHTPVIRRPTTPIRRLGTGGKPTPLPVTPPNKVKLSKKLGAFCRGPYLETLERKRGKREEDQSP